MKKKQLLSGVRLSGNKLFIPAYLSLALFLALPGCSAYTKLQHAYVKAQYGLREPRMENEHTITESAQKHGLNRQFITTVAESDYASLFKEFGNSIPEAMIFDRQGNYIEYKDSAKACNAGLFKFIPALTRQNNYKIIRECYLNEEISKLRTIDGQPLPGNYLDTTADYYIFLSWAAYVGKLNEDHVKIWQDLSAQNPNAKIQVVEINFDTQQWWQRQNENKLGLK